MGDLVPLYAFRSRLRRRANRAYGPWAGAHGADRTAMTEAAAADAKPACVVSLDFELRWGLHDRLGLDMDRYRRNLEGVHEVVPPLLEMLRERNLRATWAIVGAVACRDWTEYFERAPRPPRYARPELAMDPRCADLDRDGHLHFAPDLVERIVETPGQEPGTHTFTHLPMREPGVEVADVAADLAAVAALWRERFGAPPVSLVFPRNQAAFHGVLRASGIRVWRETAGPWYHDCNDTPTNGARPRALRLLDDVNPWVRRAAPLEGGATRSSLFVRFTLPSPAWRLQIARIEHELDHLRRGEVFHLWWHPHNLGADVGRSLARAREVLDRIAERASQGTLRSRTMGELAPRIAGPESGRGTP